MAVIFAPMNWMIFAKNLKSNPKEKPKKNPYMNKHIWVLKFTSSCIKKCKKLM